MSTLTSLQPVQTGQVEAGTGWTADNDSHDSLPGTPEHKLQELSESASSETLNHSKPCSKQQKACSRSVLSTKSCAKSQDLLVPRQQIQLAYGVMPSHQQSSRHNAQAPTSSRGQSSMASTARTTASISTTAAPCITLSKPATPQAACTVLTALENQLQVALTSETTVDSADLAASLVTQYNSAATQQLNECTTKTPHASKGVNVAKQQRTWAEAYELLQKAAAMCEEDGLLASKPELRLKLLSTTSNNLGCYFRQKGRLQAALHYLQQAVELDQQIADNSNSASTLLNLAAVYSGLGRHQEALTYAHKALQQAAAALGITLAQLEPAAQSKSRTELVDTFPELKGTNVELVGTLASAYYNKGAEYEHLSKPQEAHTCFRVASKIATAFLGRATPLAQAAASAKASTKAAALLAAEDAKYKPATWYGDRPAPGWKLTSGKGMAHEGKPAVLKPKQEEVQLEVQQEDQLRAEAAAKVPTMSDTLSAFQLTSRATTKSKPSLASAVSKRLQLLSKLKRTL